MRTLRWNCGKIFQITHVPPCSCGLCFMSAVTWAGFIDCKPIRFASATKHYVNAWDVKGNLMGHYYHFFFAKWIASSVHRWRWRVDYILGESTELEVLVIGKNFFWRQGAALCLICIQDRIKLRGIASRLNHSNPRFQPSSGSAGFWLLPEVMHHVITGLVHSMSVQVKLHDNPYQIKSKIRFNLKSLRLMN